jgi:Polyketide cyclase / dehydrase and lipid transport
MKNSSIQIQIIVKRNNALKIVFIEEGDRKMMLFLVLVLLLIMGTSSFLSTEYSSTKAFQVRRPSITFPATAFLQNPLMNIGTGSSHTRTEIITRLPMVWWFGGSENTDERTDDDSCELVAVRIERTSSNSRRIFGEISIPNVSMDAVWSILTDYDNLSIHVPNLVESKIIQRGTAGRPSDGQYKCRLYQKGAQKIIGFEFGASVTMDMRESITFSPDQTYEIKQIGFKCYDSFFFQEFDGEWKVYERPGPSLSLSNGDVSNSMESVLSYVVDVRPKGPVPVAALEWRIREDVPTNLRAVKKAAMQYQMNRQRQILESSNISTIRNRNQPVGDNSNKKNGKVLQLGQPAIASQITQRINLANDARLKVQWYKDETMATYLSDAQ